MELKVKTSCPLGHKCESIDGGEINRCAWFVKLEGKCPQTGKDVDEWRCSIAWQPILMIEQSGQVRNVAVSIQSTRNEMLERQDKALQVLNSND